MTKTLHTVKKSSQRVRAIKIVVMAVILIIGIARATVWFTHAQSLPTDAQATCIVTPAAFANWFETGAISLNGVVKPADSVTFPDTPNCSFYQWSWQMFLWVTSPSPSRYGGGKHIFNSGTFYDVSPPDANNDQIFIPHTSGSMPALGLRTAQVGSHGLPVVMDIRGRMFEIEQPRISLRGKQLILNRSGRPIEIDRIVLDRNRKPIFLDNTGKVITSPKPILGPKLSKTLTVQKFMVSGIPVFLDPVGNVIETSVGQADHAALLAQNGSLVYYLTTVNDVFAYFLTGAKNGGITPAPTQFPTTPADLNKIVAFAAAQGKVFFDPNALAIELKSAWVEAAGLPNLNSYITMQATIPTYKMLDSNHWVLMGQKTVQLAMVAMHVVGSTAGHPEMIWATFEHFGNTPNAAYKYNSTTGPKTVSQDTTGTWLFCASSSTGPFNMAHITASSADLFSVSPFNISPSDTIRWKPWGAAFNASPNPVDPTPAASNTEIISINNSVLGKLVSGDIRRNYFMTGATWTIGGAAPAGSFANPGNTGIALGKEVGTSQSSNSTMETYQQVNTLWDKFGNNCFRCHITNTTDVSHIYGHLKPLF